MPTVNQIFLIVLGVALIAVAAWSVRMSARARRWPATTGLITSSRLVSSYDSSPDAEIRYTYKVSGVEYQSSNIGYGGHWGSEDSTLVAKYPVGAVVTVYYEPELPSRALLERGRSLVWLAFVFGGALFIALGTFAL
jgi:hypothetical protein